MHPARAKMNSLLANLDNDGLLAACWLINKPWSDYSDAEHTARTALLAEYETRHGGEAVDLLMDAMDEAVGETVWN